MTIYSIKKTLYAIFLTALMACSLTQKKESMNNTLHPMLMQIYQLPKPKGFEQVNVSNVVAQYISLDQNKEDVLFFLKNIAKLNLLERSSEHVSASHTLGAAMFDVDARAIVLQIYFNEKKQVSKIQAIYIKNQ